MPRGVKITGSVKIADPCPVGEPRTTMPKQKTHKASKKRFRISANGKVKHRSSFTSHLLSRRSQKRKRNLRGTHTVALVEEKRIHNLLLDNSY